MKFLLELPPVVALAIWLWGEDQTCLDAFPFMPMDCWSALAAKGIGIAIILASCLNKAPIMRNILAARSVEGLSRFSFYGDALVYANGSFYGLLEGHPFTAFGENVALLIQTLLIVALVWRYSKVSAMEKGLVALFATCYVLGVNYVLPSHLHSLLMASITPVYLYARGLQIWETFRAQHTGAQSIVSIAMSLVGSIIRILTTLKEVGMDWAVLGNYSLGVVLNGTCFAQYYYYRRNTERFLQEQQSKKES